MIRTKVNPIEEQRGVPRVPEKPLNMGLKKLAERDYQLWVSRGKPGLAA